MRIPVATYRLQFNPEFDFRKAREKLPYLLELGITDIYASPVFRARKGSPHGYDVVDMNQLNPDLGSTKDFERLISQVKKYHMGWIQDIVPNHMAFDGENQMLMDVLENGKYSEYYDFFDIEWNHFYESLADRVLAPFLGRHYSESLESNEIKLRYGENGFFINYYSLNLPIKIESYAGILMHRLPLLRKKLGDDNPDLTNFQGILYSLNTLSTSLEERLGRYSQIQFIKRMFWDLYNSSSEIQEFIRSNIEIFNGEKASKEGVNLLDTLLSQQLFRLSFWKVATEELNYRRFFNINGLISLRMENQRAFNGTHSLVMNLLKEKKISGLRIDHIDGLYDPSGYLKTLRERAKDVYLVVEKILGPDEDLPSLWATQGTTGYDFLNYVNGLFLKEENGRLFNKLYYNFTGFKTSYDVLLYEKKKLIIEKDMTGDVDNIAHLLKRISGKNRYGNDMTLYGLRKAIVEILAYFPVYRTYVRGDYYSEADRRYITEAVGKARDANPALVYELNFIELFLLMESGDLPEEERDEWIHFIMRFQQLTGPLMAKGFEDTTLYVYNRLLSLNDVGGSPDRFGTSLTEFHEYSIRRSRRQPYSMNATSTHDSKRGEDIRARLNVLSEIPELWESHLKKWSRLNRRKKKSMKGVVIPDKNDEYFLYQTLLGAFPFKADALDGFKVRLKEYIIKAVREAKVHTAWLKPDTDYEENYTKFIDKILTPTDGNHFLQDFLLFQETVSFYGIFNSLSQTLIKMTAPGIPDFYQGSEFWDLNLVDPDNRRPVDFDLRMWLLREIKAWAGEDVASLIQTLFSTRGDGRIKLFLISRVLAARTRYSNLFEKGTYIPLQTNGKYKDNIIAFARAYKPVYAVTIAPRFLTDVVDKHTEPFGKEVWYDTEVTLPEDAPDSWIETLTDSAVSCDGSFSVDAVFRLYPGALLISAPDAQTSETTV